MLIRITTGILTLLLFSSAELLAQQSADIPQYICPHANSPIVIDGNPGDSAWMQAEWTPFFVDLKTGEDGEYPTAAKLLWDDEYLYLLVCLVDPHLWAEQTKRESKVYLDNAFELFVDPDGDGKNYLEYEINALGTTWDLVMNRPYREGGEANSAFDLKDVVQAISLNGTINDPQGTDVGWTLELAIPFSNFENLCSNPVPTAGDTWRINLARVHWVLEVVDGKYQKKVDPATNRSKAHYWVWSPHGEVNMHRPDRFGELLFK